MEAILEREVKLDPGDLRLEQLGGEPLPTRTLTSTYFDTADLRLLRLGITLRRRLEDGAATWQLKLPRTGGRLEIAAGEGQLAPPGELLELLAGPLHGRVVERAATLETTRHAVRLDGCEVVLDDVLVVDGPRTGTAFRELEVEGPDEESVARVVRRTGAEAVPLVPKVAQALDAPAAPDVPGDAPLRDQLGAALSDRLASLLAHDPGARLGDDPEDLHDLRVAVRRLRALLRTARPALDREWSEPLRAELGWLGRELGPARDADVLVDHVSAEVARLDDGDAEAAGPLLAALAAGRGEARERLLAALRSVRYFALLDRLEEAAADPRVVDGGQTPAALATRELARLRRAAAELRPESSDEELHELRIRAKRARYAAEFAAPSVGKPARRFVERAKRFQDVVGAHQDAIVAEARIREAAGAVPAPAALVAGRLVERQRRRRRDARAALPSAWRKLERAGERAFG